MKCPQELYLLPQETYPTDRNTVDVVENPIVMKNMTQMAQYVYQIYMNKVNSMKTAMVSRPKLYTLLVLPEVTFF